MLIQSISQWTVRLVNFMLDVGAHQNIQGSDFTWQKPTSPGSCLHNRVAFPDSKSYLDFLGSYWSVKEVDVRPNCIISPRSATEVSQVVRVITAKSQSLNETCKFAIKGGGHTPFAGAANIDAGVVIRLDDLPSAGLAADHKTITVSPSTTWDEVFSVLDVFHLATLGGRVGGVGVGGLTTGCGISYFSPRFGFTCNMVENFEVVLASGDVVNANATSNRPLWIALRGGSNNYGIVTSITLRTFSQGSFWGGQTFHPISTRKTHFKALENLIAQYPYDEYAHFINTVAISNLTRFWFIGNSLQYTKSDPPVPFPEVFKPFTDIPRISLFPGAPDNTLRVDNHTAFTLEYASLNVYPKRWQFATVSFGNSAAMMEQFFLMANETIQPFVALPGFQLSISYQPMPTLLTERRDALDSLGPIQTEGNMFFIHWAMAVDGSETKTDAIFQQAVQKLFRAAEKKAAESNLQRSYLPLTYADSWQDPIGRRSKGTVEQMWRTSRAYDPDGVFQSLVPGGFKLPK
ncbi:oxidoreductase [Corynespora cassiicola Philippines]|uniref:Oxidoreductase n=1 Tax=Corynespora cassiicola Philippines TaxID=1448308 RepID=A0A2T2NAD4_CORCC|nr:oxidoreductase [Corynespora cassiicola Philippines]